MPYVVAGQNRERTHSDEEARLLSKEDVGMVFFGEHELASAMTRHVLARRGIATP